MIRFEDVFPVEFDNRLRGKGVGLNNKVPVPFPAFYDPSDFFLPSDFAVSLQDTGTNSAAFAEANYTAEEIFDLYSNARTNPGLTFWIDPVNGNDTTGNGLSEATAWRSIVKAIQAANAAGQSVKINFRAAAASDSGDSAKNQSFCGGSMADLNNLSVDCCFQFYNGVATLSVHNQFAAPALHTGATYSYAVAITTATDNVLDLTDVDDFGIPKAMQYVPYVASGDIPPGCWTTNGSMTVIRRKDNVAVTNTLCRILEISPNVRTTRNVSLGFFPTAPSDTLRLYGGGNANGGFDVNIGASVTDTTVRAICAKNVTVINYGFNSTGAGRCWSIDGINGIAFLENCAALNARTDLFNLHCSRGSTVSGVRTRVVTLNCVGIGAGVDTRPNGQASMISCNGHTLHEDVRAMDFGGYYAKASGGCVRNIGTSKSYYAGTFAHDRGDRWFGSTTYPTGFRSQDTAEIYCFRTKVGHSGVGASISYNQSGGVLAKRDCWPNRGHEVGQVTSW